MHFAEINILVALFGRFDHQMWLTESARKWMIDSPSARRSPAGRFVRRNRSNFLHLRVTKV
jgi:hypothetical protein